MSKFQIDLENYPALYQLFDSDQQEFASLVRPILEHIDNAVAAERNEIAKEVYKMKYTDMVDQIMFAFFNPEGIVQYHKNNAEKEGLRGLGMNLHPLAIFTNGAAVYNAKGDLISPDLDNFNLQDWLYSLFYGARFVSWQELAEYIALGEYELIDVLKARNFEQLAAIQPALNYQEKNGIPKGKLIAGTGFFDCGRSKNSVGCLACGEGNNEVIHTEGLSYCLECRAGFKHID